VTWHGSETLPSFNRSDPFEPDPVDTGVGKGTDRSLSDPPSIAQSRISNIQKLRSNMKHTLSALALLSSATTALFAEESAVPAIPELPVTIVTGELWESELQKTTASVTVLNQASLEDKGVQHFEDVINTIPNLTWTGGTSRPRYIQIRGIGENSQFEGETPDSSVRFLIDDLDLTGLGTVGNLFDVQQVEILRGAQAGAFGANAAGGVIQIVTNDPTPYWTGQVEATVGTDSLFSEGIAVGGPLLKNDIEQLSFRFALHQLNQDGFRDNKSTGDDGTNERDELISRLKVRWLANEDWQFDGSLFYADIDNGYDEFTLNNSRTNTYSDEPGRDEQETFGSSLRGIWTGMEKVELVTVSSFTTSDSTYGFDGDWGAGDTALSPSTSTYTDFLEMDRDRDVFSQEIRLNSKDKTDALGWIDRWTIGVFGQSLSEESYAVWDSGAIWDTDFESDSIALFGQGTHEFSSDTRLTFQLRVEYYEVDVDASGDFYGTLFDYSLDEEDTLWGGNITLVHDLDSKTQAHFTLSRGYKAGGASMPNFTGNEAITYDEETLYTVEAGIRSNFFEDKVDASLTVFYIYRDEPQFRDSQGAGSFFDYITTNGDSAEHFGAEGEATWYIARNWSLNGTVGLLDAKRDSYTARGVDVDSRKLANAPGFTYSARLDYNGGTGLFGSLELVGSDDYYESNSHSEKRSSFSVVNASFGYRYENWTFTIWSKNLLDEEYEERIFFFNNTDFTTTNTRYEAPAAPRTFGVTANYTW
jgi:iron complex outermembrane receptor protein